MAVHWWLRLLLTHNATNANITASQVLIHPSEAVSQLSLPERGYSSSPKVLLGSFTPRCALLPPGVRNRNILFILCLDHTLFLRNYIKCYALNYWILFKQLQVVWYTLKLLSLKFGCITNQLTSLKIREWRDNITSSTFLMLITHSYVKHMSV